MQRRAPIPRFPSRRSTGIGQTESNVICTQGIGIRMGISEPSGLELEWLPEIEDYYEAFRANGLAQGLRWRSPLLLGVGLILLVTGLTAVFTHAFPPWVALIPGIAVTIYGNLLSPVYPRQVRTLWRRTAAMRDPVRCRLAAGEGLTPLSVPGSETVSWSRFVGVMETDRVFVLQATKNRTRLSRLLPRTTILTVLAKRGLRSPGDLPGLRELLLREVGDRARLNPGEVRDA